MARTPYGLPRPGSTAWAAKKVERILDREAKDRQTETRRRWAEEARPFKVRDHPVGGDSWAAQQIRLIRQREARARLGLEATRARPARTAAAEVGIGPIVSRRDEVGPAVGSAFAGAPPSAGLLSAYAAPDRTAVAWGRMAATRIPTPPPGAPRAIPAAAVLAPALPWIVGQVPSWLGGLGAVLGLAPFLSGDTPEEDDYCYRRWQEELARCSRWPKKWVHGCHERANDRYGLCVSNGGTPRPDEPAEWGEKDMEVWYNPDR